jgi:hypothetical protein
MECSLCTGEEVVRIRSDPYQRSYPCPECRNVSYNIMFEVTGFDLKQAAEDPEEHLAEIGRNLRDRLLDKMIDEVGEFNQQYEESEDKHKLSARVIVVRPLTKKGG